MAQSKSKDTQKASTEMGGSMSTIITGNDSADIFSRKKTYLIQDTPKGWVRYGTSIPTRPVIDFNNSINSLGETQSDTLFQQFIAQSEALSQALDVKIEENWHKINQLVNS